MIAMADGNIAIGLKELQNLVKKGVDSAVPGYCWVRAEISEMKVNVSGHCYMTLVEKGGDGVSVAAKAQAIIWSSSYGMISSFFRSSTGSALSAGMKVLVRVQVQYSVLYGLSLVVSDIDPSFTVGELEMARRQTLKRLESDGVIGMNAQLHLPAVPRRFAVISSPDAAGYGDFMKHLHGNEYGFRFITDLHEAVMQGASSPASVISALERIAASGVRYDAVLVMRGGGSVTDLACFDDYELAMNIAQFPLPVMTAIGHDRDVHICDIVAHTSVKTPTALADFLIDMYAGQDAALQTMATALFRLVKQRFADEDLRLAGMSAELEKAAAGAVRQHVFRMSETVEVSSRKIASLVSARLSGEKSSMAEMSFRLKSAVVSRMASYDRNLEMLWFRLNGNDPVAMLEKGFAMLRGSAGRIRACGDVSEGDSLEVRLVDGTLVCEVKGIVRDN